MKQEISLSRTISASYCNYVCSEPDQRFFWAAEQVWLKDFSQVADKRSEVVFLATMLENAPSVNDWDYVLISVFTEMFYYIEESNDDEFALEICSNKVLRQVIMDTDNKSELKIKLLSLLPPLETLDIITDVYNIKLSKIDPKVAFGFWCHHFCGSQNKDYVDAYNKINEHIYSNNSVVDIIADLFVTSPDNDALVFIDKLLDGLDLKAISKKLILNLKPYISKRKRLEMLNLLHQRRGIRGFYYYQIYNYYDYKEKRKINRNLIKVKQINI